MDYEALAEALAVLRAADALRHVLPPGSRDRDVIDAHILILDREIHALVTGVDEDVGADAIRLRAAARATRISVGQVQAELRW